MTRNRHNYWLSALTYHCILTGSLQRLKDSPADDNDRTVIDAAVKCTEPIEMLNDEKERHRYATLAAIQMIWIQNPDAPPKERDRLILDGKNMRINKVKAWPNTSNPAFYELHAEDES